MRRVKVKARCDQKSKLWASQSQYSTRRSPNRLRVKTQTTIKESLVRKLRVQPSSELCVQPFNEVVHDFFFIYCTSSAEPPLTLYREMKIQNIWHVCKTGLSQTITATAEDGFKCGLSLAITEIAEDSCNWGMLPAISHLLHLLSVVSYPCDRRRPHRLSFVACNQRDSRRQPQLRYVACYLSSATPVACRDSDSRRQLLAKTPQLYAF